MDLSPLIGYNKMVVNSGIPSARKKLARAEIHLQELEAEVDRFREESPYDFDITSEGNKRWTPDIYVQAVVTQAPKTPDSWALITGDILTNLRAALDHAVFPHIRAKKPDLAQHYIQFPIEDAKAQWENKAKWFQHTVSKVVGDAQPYRAPDADRSVHRLRVLRELVNMDKHRALVIASYAAHAFDVGEHSLCTLVSKTVHKEAAMTVGTVIAEAHLMLTQDVHGDRWEQIPTGVTYSECIVIPGVAEPQDLRNVVQELVKKVGALLDLLEAAKC